MLVLFSTHVEVLTRLSCAFSLKIKSGILLELILNGTYVYRGQMGLPEEDQKKSQELRLQVNGGINMDRSTKELTQTNEISACGSQMEGAGCCHIYGMTLSTCCQGPVLSEIADNDNLNEEAKFDTEKRSKKQTSRNNSGKGACTRKVCTVPTWVEIWEREDTYATLAVIGAAVSVAVAYNCYKQLT